MNYVYAVLLLHSGGKEINESNLKSVVKATGEAADEAKIKVLLDALSGVDITEALAKAAVAQTVVAAPEAKAEKKEEKREEATEKKVEEASTGLASLFG